jgi:hypothetical protein
VCGTIVYLLDKVRWDAAANFELFEPHIDGLINVFGERISADLHRYCVALAAARSAHSLKTIKRTLVNFFIIPAAAGLVATLFTIDTTTLGIIAPISFLLLSVILLISLFLASGFVSMYRIIEPRRLSRHWRRDVPPPPKLWRAFILPMGLLASVAVALGIRGMYFNNERSPFASFLDIYVVVAGAMLAASIAQYAFVFSLGTQGLLPPTLIAFEQVCRLLNLGSRTNRRSARGSSAVDGA